MIDVPQLQLQQVSVATPLGNQYLLQDISFDVVAGDRIGLVGASGAGKTTLLRLLNRLTDPTRGTIVWRGQPLAHYPVIDLRRRLMLVPQEPKLLGMTVQEALAYPLMLQKLPQATIQSRLTTWRSRLSIPDDWLQRTELQLSLGQRQLVGLARACLMEPELLLLDEPTSALDPGRIAQVLQILDQGPWTLIIASHQPSLLAKLCGQVLWLEGGALRQKMTSAEVDWQAIQTALEQQSQAIDSDWD